MKFPFFISCVLLYASNAFCQDFEIYVSDAGNFSNPPWQILKFDENGDNPEVFIDVNLAWPQDIVFLEDAGTVLISNLNNGRITRYNVETGEYIDNFATGNGKVRRYQLDGTFVDEFTSVGVTQSIGLDWDSAGNLYVSLFDGKSVRKFDSNGNDQGLFTPINRSRKSVRKLSQ